MNRARNVRLLVLGNGAPGAEKQAIALGKRLGHNLLKHTLLHRSHVLCPPVECVRVTLENSCLLSPLLQIFGARLTGNPLFGYEKHVTNQLFPVQPSVRDLNVVIGCGRSTVSLCAVMKQLEPQRTFNVQIQHPRVPLTWFNAVIAPRHDFPRGEGGVSNLFLTSGAVHDITPEMLQQHGREWCQELDEKLRGRQKRVVWLLGGPCRGFAFIERDAERMVEELVRALSCDDEVALLVTFSRRTPKNVQKVVRRELKIRFPIPGQLLLWEGTERRNPYYALLSTASCIVTTPDSISMTTEAIASGKPVFTIGLETCTGKFLRFHEYLFKAKAMTPFTPDAVTALLRHDIQNNNALSAALNNEISTIVDAITKDIHRTLEHIETTT
ncbi:unnamed protein product [Peronospora belbahrii]|uniref:Mitochondrial fission protein ELM1 n=1 Tax=Peronospora belbahrii TaxID=622444 RepID=A0AAU9L9T1_9STRA|nr:unnamed protein product [Peronospora belbahrii]CAH0520976.1 unnamed protein product [Peronospora belbahrii]